MVLMVIAVVQMVMHYLGIAAIGLGVIALFFGNSERAIELILGGLVWLAIKYVLGFIVLSVSKSGVRRPHEASGEKLIGKHVEWSAVKFEPLLIKKFSPMAVVQDDGTVKAAPNLPYGLLTVVKSPEGQELVMPILHRIDFLNISKVITKRDQQKDKEHWINLFAVYTPHKQFASVRPSISIMMSGADHFDPAYLPENKPDDSKIFVPLINSRNY